MVKRSNSPCPSLLRICSSRSTSRVRCGNQAPTTKAWLRKMCASSSRKPKKRSDTTGRSSSVTSTWIPTRLRVVDFRGLNAMMTRRLTQRGPRTLGGITRKTFYNPMWSLLGDREEPPGSYYFRRTGARGYYWHLLDQVLLRSSVLTSEPPTVCVLTRAGTRSLLSKRASHPEVSDHLPLFVRLHLRSMSSGT